MNKFNFIILAYLFVITSAAGKEKPPTPQGGLIPTSKHILSMGK
jgi:hypothetical protein